VTQYLIGALVCLAGKKIDNRVKKMGKLVTIIVCPNCESEMIKIEDSRFGDFFECCTCKKRAYVPENGAYNGPSLFSKK
jgi:ssDNA-binding Zn-finger/Zn-ribbon topoisomerase 1